MCQQEEQAQEKSQHQGVQQHLRYPSKYSLITALQSRDTFCPSATT